MKTILVAINNDAKQEIILNQAIAMARRFSSDLIIAHVNEIVLPQTGTMSYGGNKIITVESISKTKMHEYYKLAKSAGVKNVETKIIDGLDVSSIITGDLCEKYHPDLIICGDNKEHTFIDRVLGSTATSITKYAPCSVYIVK